MQQCSSVRKAERYLARQALSPPGPLMAMPGAPPYCHCLPPAGSLPACLLLARAGPERPPPSPAPHVPPPRPYPSTACFSRQ